jgi:hypothetical protein
MISCLLLETSLFESFFQIKQNRCLGMLNRIKIVELVYIQKEELLIF